MSVRAEWHTPRVAIVDDDPFAERIEDVGTPIDLGAPGELATLNRKLVASIAEENRLFNAGVSCRVKDAADTSCHVCPLYRQDSSPEAELCAIGREQERLCTLIVVANGR